MAASFGILAGVRVADAASYMIRCQNTNLSNPTITSTLGEARPAGQFFRTPTRFHGGVDTSDCLTGHTVQAIYSGTVTVSNGCRDGNCLRVWDTPTHAFDYVHVNSTPTPGSYVIAGSSTVGTIVGGANGNHLHLNELIKIGNTVFRVNPQRAGALTYLDSQAPVFVSTNIGAVQGESIFLAEDRGVMGEGQLTPNLFRFRSNTWYVQGHVDALVAGRDEPAVTVSGVTRKGIYEIAAAPRTAGSLGAAPKIVMNNFNDSGGGATNASTIYYRRNANSDTHIATNLRINDTPNLIATNSYWDTNAELPGPVQFCVVMMDSKGNTTVPSCVNAYIDRSAATIIMSNAGGAVADGGATSTATITIAATDSGGIYSMKLEKSDVSYSSTNYVSGVQTSAQNTFPDSGVLTDGQYTATVVDLAGNSAQASFTIGCKPFLVENA